MVVLDPIIYLGQYVGTTEAYYGSNFDRRPWNRLKVTQLLKTHFINILWRFYFPKIKNGSVGLNNICGGYSGNTGAYYDSNFVQRSWNWLKFTQPLKSYRIKIFLHFYFPKIKNGSAGPYNIHGVIFQYHSIDFLWHTWNWLKVTQLLKTYLINISYHFYFPKIKNGGVGPYNMRGDIIQYYRSLVWQ